MLNVIGTSHIIIDIDKTSETMIDIHNVSLKNDLKNFLKNIKLQRSLFEIYIHYCYYNLIYFFNFIKNMLCESYIYQDVYILNYKNEILLQYNYNSVDKKYNVVLCDNGILIYVENNNNIFIKYENIVEYTYYKKNCILFNVLGKIDNEAYNYNYNDTNDILHIKVFLFCNDTIGSTIFNRLRNYINYHIKYNTININTLIYYHFIHMKRRRIKNKNNTDNNTDNKNIKTIKNKDD